MSIQFVSAFLLGFFELSLAVPLLITVDSQLAGYLLLVIATAASLGSVCFVYMAAPLNGWLLNRYGRNNSIMQRTERYLNKYGVIGLGLFAPIILGHALTAIGAVSLGANPKKLLLWLQMGILLWCAVVYLLYRAGGFIAWM